MAVFALLDGNNFYVSCERIFNVGLHNRPVIVLSNNDGCAIARSEEAKALGIKMGTPFFQCRKLINTDGLIALSANFTLYGNISSRMMTLAAEFGPEQEIYSIDECFIGLHGVRDDLTLRGREIRTNILQQIKIPCGIGIGPTKTLAKLANHIAKDAERKPGSYPIQHAQVCNLGALSQAELHQILDATPVHEIWGVGRRIGNTLVREGIKTAYQLSRIDSATIRKRWNVTLEKTVRELNGMSCIAMEEVTAKKQIACTRSFGHPVTDFRALSEAVSEYASRAAEKLRSQNSVAGMVHVFIHTSPFRPGKQKSVAVTTPIRPSDDSSAIARAAVCALKRIHSEGYLWMKAGVILMEIQSSDAQQKEFGFSEKSNNKRTQLMKTLDEINARYGRGSLALASTGIAQQSHEWDMKQERRSPRYTTDWFEIPIVKS